MGTGPTGETLDSAQDEQGRKQILDRPVLGGGLRFDAGKNRLDLLPFDALTELGMVYTMGAQKYAPRNWELGMPWSKVLGPMLRHLFTRIVTGERLDPESGRSHLAHVAWNALALLTYELRGLGEDDITQAAK